MTTLTINDLPTEGFALKPYHVEEFPIGAAVMNKNGFNCTNFKDNPEQNLQHWNMQQELQRNGILMNDIQILEISLRLCKLRMDDILNSCLDEKGDLKAPDKKIFVKCRAWVPNESKLSLNKK
jgi:hypothetical protein